MMFHAQSSSRNHCSLLAVLCGSRSDYKRNHSLSSSDDYAPRYPIPQLSSSGRLEVQVLNNPSIDTFRQTLQSFEPNIVYLQGERTEYSEEVGSLRWGDVDLSYPQALCDLFGSSLPGTVYLEITNGEELAEALYSKGVPYIIYWKSTFSDYAALHFRQALCYVMQSSCSHICDAFQLAHASFRLYCSRDNNGLPSNIQKPSSNPGPCLLGEPPKIDITIPETDVPDEQSSSDNLPAIKIYDDDVTLRFLVCGLSCTLV